MPDLMGRKKTRLHNRNNQNIIHNKLKYKLLLTPKKVRRNISVKLYIIFLCALMILSAVISNHTSYLAEAIHNDNNKEIIMCVGFNS